MQGVSSRATASGSVENGSVRASVLFFDKLRCCKNLLLWTHSPTAYKGQLKAELQAGQRMCVTLFSKLAVLREEVDSP